MPKPLAEREVIEALIEAFPDAHLGDDAAFFPLQQICKEYEGMILSSDAVAEGVHFDRRYCTLSQVVQKLITSNVSDVYASGAEPRMILFTAGLGPGCSREEVNDMIDGIRKGISFYSIRLMGGDTVSSPCGFFFNVAITGFTSRRGGVTRAGAEEGDSLVLFGPCGGSKLGRLILETLIPGENDAGLPGEASALLPSWPEIESLVAGLTIGEGGEWLERKHKASFGDALALAARHIVPSAKPVEESLYRGERPLIRAMIDVSDGLARDLRNLCSSSDVGAEIFEEALPVPEGFEALLPGMKEFWTELILSSGEEYEMLAACREAPGMGAVIGRVVSAQQGFTLVGRDGERRELPDTGYQHEF